MVAYSAWITPAPTNATSPASATATTAPTRCGILEIGKRSLHSSTATASANHKARPLAEMNLATVQVRASSGASTSTSTTSSARPSSVANRRNRHRSGNQGASPRRSSMLQPASRRSSQWPRSPISWAQTWWAIG